MKFRLLVKLGEIILGHACPDNEPRADMFMPIKLLAFSVLLLMGGIAACVYAAINFSWGAVVVAVLAFILGCAAVLCWKNQTIRVLSDEEFEYSTFLGRKTVYRFSDIKFIKRNNDSMTMYVGNGKVHIESMAILTDRLVACINQQLSNLYGKEE